MKKEIDKCYRGFLGRIRYIHDYKDNLENDLVSEQRLIAANNKIDKLQKKIQQMETLNSAINELLDKDDKRIQVLNEKYGELMKQLKKEQEEKINMQKFINELANNLEVKEYQRRINATKIGHKQRKINKLEKILDEKNIKIMEQERKINFLKSNRHAPTKEEIEAYELQMKEVEKRIKNK